jgi:hypothetical protein
MHTRTLTKAYSVRPCPGVKSHQYASRRFHIWRSIYQSLFREGEKMLTLRGISSGSIGFSYCRCWWLTDCSLLTPASLITTARNYHLCPDWAANWVFSQWHLRPHNQMDNLIRTEWYTFNESLTFQPKFLFRIYELLFSIQCHSSLWL